MLSALRIIHPPSSDNPTLLPILILTVDNKRFLFNVPEGTTRILLERGAGGALKNLKGIFLPRSGIDECGGLAGVLMSSADRSIPEIDLFGPPVLSQLVCTARSYARRDGFKVSIHEASLTQNANTLSGNTSILYKDSDIAVHAISVFPNNFSLSDMTKSSLKESLDRPSKKHKSETNQNSLAPTAEVCKFLDLMFPSKSQKNENLGTTVQNEEGVENVAYEEGDQRVKVTQSRSQKLSPPPLPPVELTKAMSGQAPALTYIVQGSPVRGRFDVQKAQDIGVPDPSLYRILADGKDVEVSRPKEWFQWDNVRKSAWLKFCHKVRNSGKHGKNAKSKKSTLDAEDDDFAKVETEIVTIHGPDLLAPPTPSTSFAQVYLPSIDYLNSFFSPDTQEQFEGRKEQIHTIIHAVHPDVLETSQYQAFIKSFPATHHYVSCRGYVPDKIGYPSFSTSMLRLSRIDPTLFKVPEYSLLPQRSLAKIGLDLPNVLPVDIETMIGLQPRKPPSSRNASIRDFNFYTDSPEAKTLASFSYEPKYELQAALLKRGRQRWAKYLELVSLLHEEEMQENSQKSCSNPLDRIALTTLGTGSALPSKHRNVSSTLLHLPEGQGYILLDAGEGTYGQLCRKFGTKVDQIMRDIRLIFLSHTHGDHHMGTAKLLAERKKLLVDRPLFVISNTFTRSYLHEVNDIQSLDIRSSDESKAAMRGVVFLDSEQFDSWHGVQADNLAENPTLMEQEDEAYRAFTEYDVRKYSARSSWTSKSEHELERRVQTILTQSFESKRHLREAVKKQIHLIQEILGGTKVFTTEVDHRGAKCYGIVLRGNGWSLAYSGDTQPCERFIKAGKGVDILLHEATFENGEEENAANKKHSTVGQALEVARGMGARKLLLTHFSQRYPNIPKIESEKAKTTYADTDPSVGISFDLMTVRPKDIGKTERYREALQVLFDAEEDDGNDDGGEGGEGEDKGNEKGNIKANGTKETQSKAKGEHE